MRPWALASAGANHPARTPAASGALSVDNGRLLLPWSRRRKPKGIVAAPLEH